MASAILASPLRAQLASDRASIAIAYNGSVAAGTFALTQLNCSLVNIAGDTTAFILSSLTADKYQNLTLPGICALVQVARSCKYLRDISRDVKTPIDAAIIERDDAASVEGDQNLNRQRFTLHALQKTGGMPAGVRYRLISTEMIERNGGNPELKRADDPFILVYRDARNYYDRPVTMAIAKPQPNGSLLCIEISIREMLVFFGGHSNKSVFNATKAVIGRSVIDKWVYNRYHKCNTSISVWGSAASKVALVSEDELQADSINPVQIKVTPTCDDDDLHRFRIIEQGHLLSGKVAHRFNGTVTFTFPNSTCCAFAPENQLSIDYTSHLISLLGCHELPSAAVMPTAKGPMISRSSQWLNARRTKRREDAGSVSKDNIMPVGRRAAVQAADLELQRAANEESLMEDGQYLPGHPAFERIKSEVDEINERLEEEGKDFRYTDPRIKLPSPKRARVRSVLAIAN